MVRFRDFLRDEHGSATIEFCLWIPLFMFFLAATIDASVLYLTHTEMWNIARDTARRITTRELDTPGEASNYARSQLFGDHQWYVNVWIEGNSALVVIETYIWDASVFGIWSMWGGGPPLSRTLKAEVTMRLEPPVAAS